MGGRCSIRIIVYCVYAGKAGVKQETCLTPALAGQKAHINVQAALDAVWRILGDRIGFTLCGGRRRALPLAASFPCGSQNQPAPRSRLPVLTAVPPTAPCFPPRERSQVLHFEKGERKLTVSCASRIRIPFWKGLEGSMRLILFFRCSSVPLSSATVYGIPRDRTCRCKSCQSSK